MAVSLATKIVSGDDLRRLAAEMLRRLDGDFKKVERRKDIIVALSFNAASVVLAPDQIRHCDEGIVFTRAPLRGIVTIAPRGETGSDQPAIDGLYMRLSDRRRGFGSALFEAAIRRCFERGFERIRVDVQTRAMKQLIERLPEELRAHLDIHDYSGLSLF